jgi:hypothetical protein
MPLYFERFRQALAGWAAGVHRLASGATDAELSLAAQRLGRPLPPSLRDFWASWNGADLFHEDLHILGADEASIEEGRLVIAQSSAGDRYALAADGRVVQEEASTGLRWVAGSSLERWLEGEMARGAALYDREGEFREGAFAGEELAPEVELKLARRRARIDPEAARIRFDLAMALVGADRPGDAERELEVAVALDEGSGWAWFELGRLRLRRGEAGAAEAALAHAVAADPDADHSGFFAAWAARAAHAAGDEEAAARHRDTAQQRDPQLVARQLAAAEEALGAGDAREAAEQVELALAVAPRDMRALDLSRRLRGRRR